MTSDDKNRLDRILAAAASIAGSDRDRFDLPRLRADAATAAELLIDLYGERALDRALLLESRPSATFFARMVRLEVEKRSQK